MGSQYRSSLESMIHYVLAAPGAGKSAVAPHLRAFLPDQSFWIGTRSWVPPKHWQALPSGRHHRPGLATSSWYGPLLTRSGRSALSCSSVCPPQQLSDWPNGEWLLLDCADDERRTRLAPRRNPTQMEEAVADAASDDAGHPLHPQRQPPAPGPPTPGDARRHEGPKASSQQATTAEGGFMPHGRPPTPVEALQLAQATLETWLARWPRPK
jgi:hypothetical protein